MVSDKELQAYRLVSEEEPSDLLLGTLMEKVLESVQHRPKTHVRRHSIDLEALKNIEVDRSQLRAQILEAKRVQLSRVRRLCDLS